MGSMQDLTLNAALTLDNAIMGACVRGYEGPLRGRPRDCECVTHVGPHALHMDDIAVRRSNEYLSAARLNWLAFVQSEGERLAALRPWLEQVEALEPRHD